MRFLQSRQKVLAENVANADTPGYKPKDIAQIGIDPATRGADASRRLGVQRYNQVAGLMVTSPMHIAPIGRRGLGRSWCELRDPAFRQRGEP